MRLVLQVASASRLDEALASEPPNSRDSLRIVLGVARATEALNRTGLVAGRIRPDRILIDSEAGGILVDPGFPAEFANRDTRPRGETRYLSPEERRGGETDVRSNVYSLGALLSTLLTGGPPRRPRNGGGSRTLTSVVSRAMNRDPAKRYSGAEEFAVAVAAAAGAEYNVDDAATGRRDGTGPEPRTSTRPSAARRRGSESTPASKARTNDSRPHPAPPKLGGPKVAAASAGGPHGPRLPRPQVPRPQLPRLELPGIRATHGAAAGAALVAAAGALIMWSTLAGGGEGASKEATAIRSSAVRVELPPQSTRTHATRIEGVALTGAVSARSAGDRARFVVGLARDLREVNGLVRAAVAQGAVRREVKLGAIDAWRWRTPRSEAGTATTLFVAYTSRGPLVATCRETISGATGQTGPCFSALSTLRLTGPRPVAIALVEGIRRDLRTAMVTLGRERHEGREVLATAPTTEDQLNAARSLETSFRRAAQALAAITTPAGTTDLALVVAALDRTADAYGALAEAIRDGENVAFDVARREILKEEARVGTEIAAAEIP